MSKTGEPKTLGQYFAFLENIVIKNLAEKKGYSVEIATASVRETESMIAALGFLAIAFITFPFNPKASVVAGIGFGGTFTQAINYTNQKLYLMKSTELKSPR